MIDPANRRKEVAVDRRYNADRLNSSLNLNAGVKIVCVTFRTISISYDAIFGLKLSNAFRKKVAREFLFSQFLTTDFPAFFIARIIIMTLFEFF